MSSSHGPVGLVIVAALALSTWAASAAAEHQGPPPREQNSPGVEVAPGAPGPQTSSDAPHDVPSLGLTASQKQAVYQSILNRHTTKSTEPVGPVTSPT